MVERNAEYELARNSAWAIATLSNGGSSGNSRLADLPHRIEGYDISHPGCKGSASQVVFIDGNPASKTALSYKI